MKNILKVIAAAVFAAALFACSDKNPVNPTPLPPVPKPESPVETAAYAAKKADYFLRLAFDLADGYLYDNSVARKRYGTDSNYVNSLNFNEANGQGIIRSYALGSFEFWYYRDTIDASHSYDVKITTYPALSSGNTQEFKRDVVVNVASGANNGAKRYNILFTGTDTGPSESFTFDIWYQDQGRYTRNGATVGNPLIQPQTINFSITDSSGTLNNFTAVLSGVSGKIINVYESDKPSSASEFVIQSGNLTVTGSGFTINLSYSANKAVGTFSGPGFLADYYINENGVYDAYYIISGDSYNKKNFVGWDFP